MPAVGAVAVQATAAPNESRDASAPAPGFDAQLRAGEYLGFATSMLLASGILFEVPIAMAALARMGGASAALYRRQWRVAIVAIAAVAAVLPGGDPFSMALLMAPQIVLYGAGIALAARFGQAPLWRRGEPDPT